MNLYLCAFLIVSYLKTGLYLAGTVLQFACVIRLLFLFIWYCIPVQSSTDNLSTCILLLVVENLLYKIRDVKALMGDFIEEGIYLF